MLQIRKEQLQVFEALKKTKFIETMEKQLKINFPQKVGVITSQALSLLINTTIIKLEKFNIVRECDVERYLYLMFTFSFNIDSDFEYRWIQDILVDEVLSGDLKMKLMYQIAEQKINDYK